MEEKKKFIINVAFYSIIILIAAATYQFVLPILMPFIVGFCIASVVQIPLRHLKLKNAAYRRVAATLLCVAFYAIVVTLLILFGAKVVSEIGNLFRALPDLFQEYMYPFLTGMGDRILTLLKRYNPDLANQFMQIGNSAIESLAQFATDLSAGAVKILATGAIGIPGLLVHIIICIVSSFYIASDYAVVLGFIKKLIPKKHRQFVINVLRYAETAILAYIKSYSIMFVLVFLELWIGFLILDIPYAIGIAFAIALFDLMPVLGTGGILLPWAFILLCMGNFPLAIGVALLYVIITAVRHAVEPRIVGNHIGLHPLATLVAMMVGLDLMGLVGMLLFPITLVALTNLKKSTEEATAKK